jgi:hypothetical protein
MKYSLFLLFYFTALSSLKSQNVGINNTNPQTTLDIEGRLRIRPVSLLVTGNTINIPAGNGGLYTLSGTPATDFTVGLPTGMPGSFLLVENAASRIAVIPGLANILPGRARLLLRGNADWILANDSESQLEKVNESGAIGWRILGRDTANYGNIGQDAIDLSYSSGTSLVRGATGIYSTTMGYNTTAGGYNATAMGRTTQAGGFIATAMGFNTNANGDFSTAFGNGSVANGDFSIAMGQSVTAAGQWSTAIGLSTAAVGNYSTAIGALTTAKSYLSLAIGQYNDTIVGASTTAWVATDPIFTIGNGQGPGFRSNAMTVYKNGTFDLQNLFSEPSVTANKFYVINSEPYYSGRNLYSQLEKVNESGNTGWRLYGRDAANYGSIGFDAVDLSYHTAASATHGATGTNAFATGTSTTASNAHATAMGYQTTASGTYSTSLGFSTSADGISAVAMGSQSAANGEASTAMGKSTIAGGQYATAIGRFANAAGQSSLAAGEYTTAIAPVATAIGYSTTASGQYATAMGSGGTASGFTSTTMGGSTAATGTYATAIGSSTVAKGYATTSMGYYTAARAYASLAIGQYNDTISASSPSSWVASDPVFTVGNGTSPFNLSNAMTVYKNGNTDMNGFIRMGAAADGAPRIKTKKITTTLSGTAGATVAHGLTETKILQISVKVTNQFNSLVFDGNTVANNAFNAYVGGGNVVIVGAAGNSNDIVNRPATILITYEE